MLLKSIVVRAIMLVLFVSRTSVAREPYKCRSRAVQVVYKTCLGEVFQLVGRLVKHRDFTVFSVVNKVFRVKFHRISLIIHELR